MSKKYYNNHLLKLREQCQPIATAVCDSHKGSAARYTIYTSQPSSVPTTIAVTPFSSGKRALICWCTERKQFGHGILCLTTWRWLDCQIL
jgi:hypothetical protein